MKLENKNIRLWTVLAALSITGSLGTPALAVDDGARAYWKTKAGTKAVSFQYLQLDADGSSSQQFAPDQYIYPSAGVEGSISILTWIEHFSLFGRAASYSINIAGGNVDLDMNANAAPAMLLPAAVVTGSSFSQSSSGYADPSAQLVVNLIGTPRMKSNVDLLNYEPTFTLDVATFVGIPLGNYDDDKIVNLGLNRWYGRFAVPMKYHFGAFTPGYMNSIELTPSIWVFEKNDDFLGHELENDPLFQLEGHLTHDFTQTFYGSLDALYRSGFESEVDGAEAGDDLEIGTLGFTLNYQLTGNAAVRTSYSSNVFGDDELETSLIRIQFVYGWNQSNENAKKLQHGH
jgi:hypothetical protein